MDNERVGPLEAATFDLILAPETESLIQFCQSNGGIEIAIFSSNFKLLLRQQNAPIYISK